MANFEEELLKAQEELGISGYDEIGEDGFDDVSGYDEIGDDDEVGARKRRRIRRKRQGMIRIPSYGNTGQKRVMTLPCTGQLSLAAAATGNLTFTPNRNVEILDLVLDSNVAAAAAAAYQPAALHITNIVVQGRYLNAGAGVIPLTAFQPRYGFRHTPFIQWGNCDASQSVVISFVNADAATTHVINGVLFVLAVP